MCEQLKKRTLRADEIECRVQSVSKDGSGCILLLYKDARCDQRILDEIFGAFNWQRRHYECKGNLFCEVGIKNPDTGEWVYKGDCGTESNTEKEKGEASDSFKRACFNWGIGRELYTSPFIYVRLNAGEASPSNGKYYLSSRVKFHVAEITYNGNKEINRLRIADQTGATRYTYGQAHNAPAADDMKVIVSDYLVHNDKAREYYLQKYSKGQIADLFDSELNEIYSELIRYKKI